MTGEYVLTHLRRAAPVILLPAPGLLKELDVAGADVWAGQGWRCRVSWVPWYYSSLRRQTRADFREQDHVPGQVEQRGIQQWLRGAPASTAAGGDHLSLG